MAMQNVKLRRLWRRILIVLLLAVAAIYALVRALDLEVGRLLGYLGGSVALVVGTALAALASVAMVKLAKRYAHGSASKKRSSRGA
jgi:hypothetical protein